MGLDHLEPGPQVSPTRVPTRAAAPPSPAQFAELLSAARERNPELAALLVLAATGARRSQLVALRWSDVDLDRDFVTIAHSVGVGPKGLVEKATATHKVRRVALDSSTVQVLQAHRRLCADRAAQASAVIPEDGFLFTQEVDESQPWHPDAVTMSFVRLCRRAGVSGVRLDLRHFPMSLAVPIARPTGT